MAQTLSGVVRSKARTESHTHSVSTCLCMQKVHCCQTHAAALHCQPLLYDLTSMQCVSNHARSADTDATMDGTHFAKLCKDANLGLSTTDVDLAFASVRVCAAAASLSFKNQSCKLCCSML